MRRLFIILAACFLAILPGLGAETVISGRVTGGKGSVIRLMTFSDQVSYLRKTLASGHIGDDESFRLSIQLNDTIYAWLDIDFSQGEVFLQPGQSYEVEITLDESSLSASYYDRKDLTLNFLSDDQDKLNLYIRDFNGIFNDFMLNYAADSQVRGSSGSFNSFKTAVDLRFKNAVNPYFLDYVRFKTASMELFMRLKSRDRIGLEYLAGQPPAYDNIEYMDFFHLFFEKYFFSGNKYFNYKKTYDLVNGTASLGTILDSLGADPVLATVELRELVLITGLKELYSVSGFNRERVLFLAKALEESGSSAQIHEMAINLQARLKRLKPGSPAPDFTLPSLENAMTYTLADFKGKYIYLVFFDSRNPASQAEIGMAGEWHEEYKDRVRFVAVSVDGDPAVIRGNPNISPEVWTILHYNFDMELLENYDAFAFPHFILIDDQGRIVIYPAPGPSENIRQALDSI